MCFHVQNLLVLSRKCKNCVYFRKVWCPMCVVYSTRTRVYNCLMIDRDWRLNLEIRTFWNWEISKRLSPFLMILKTSSSSVQTYANTCCELFHHFLTVRWPWEGWEWLVMSKLISTPPWTCPWPWCTHVSGTCPQPWSCGIMCTGLCS